MSDENPMGQARPSRISPALEPKIRIALVAWIVCFDRPNIARGGRENGFRRHFRPIRGRFMPSRSSVKY
jgi:hypothetical protein